MADNKKVDRSETSIYTYVSKEGKAEHYVTQLVFCNKTMLREWDAEDEPTGYYAMLVNCKVDEKNGKPYDANMLFSDLKLLVACTRRGQKNYELAMEKFSEVVYSSIKIMEKDREQMRAMGVTDDEIDNIINKIRESYEKEKMEKEDNKMPMLRAESNESEEEKKEQLYNGKKLTFDDICGLEEAKTELLEILDSFENKEKYAKFNVEVPKGVILYGEPGNSKTCLAEAMANMSNAKFYKKCCSEFTAKYLGESAKNIRNFFEEVKMNQPAIIFLEECDAIMSKRGTDENSKEKNAALNQLLNELSSIADEDILVICATNFYESLDSAVKRRGRLDRHIYIGNPNKKVREEILALNLKDKPILEELHLDIIARKTSGRSGADVKGVVQEACMIAIREGKEGLLQRHLEEAVDRLVGGIKNKNNKVNDDIKLRVAWHEGNHALQAYLAGEKVNKITIISHDTSLGYVSHYSEEDKFLYNEEDLRNKIIISLAGKGAEEFKFNEKSSGCSSDLQSATNIAKLMVCDYGMSSLGKLSINTNEVFLQRLIFAEMNKIVDECYEEMMNRTKENEKILEKIVDYLMENEEMDGETLETICNE